MIGLPLDALGEHVRDLIWEQLSDELELVTCQQGVPEQIRSPQDLAEAVPAVFIDPPKWGGGRPDDSLPAIEGTVTIGLSFMRRIEAGEEHPRATIQRLQRIASLFLLPDFQLDGWDNSTGCSVEKIWPVDIQHENDLAYEDSPLKVALATVTLQATVVAYLPVG